MPSLPLRLLDAALVPVPDASRVGWLKGTQYAHRGLHDDKVVENSPTAFRLAIDAGLGIECDVRITSDDRAIVFHDPELDRLTGRPGEVARKTLAELTALPIGSGGDTIPTLRDLLDLVAGRVPLLIELKSGPGSVKSRLSQAVRRDLADYRGDVAVMSFDPHILSLFRRDAPEILRGLVVTEQQERGFSDRLARHRAFWHANPHFLAYDIRDLPSRFAAAQRARGIPVLSWTVSTPELRTRAARHADAPIAEATGLAQSPLSP